MQKRIQAISHILKQVKEAKKKEEKINILRENDSEPLRYVLELAFHPNVGWWLPPGAPPYKPLDGIDLEGCLYRESRQFPTFLSGNRPDLAPWQRENIFIQFLESIHPDDAELMLQVKDKKVKGLNVQTINEAFPGLIPT